jgi:hypothetical protein
VVVTFSVVEGNGGTVVVVVVVAELAGDLLSVVVAAEPFRSIFQYNKISLGFFSN